MSEQRQHHLSDTIFQRLLEGKSFQEYESAFKLATGLPLRLAEANPNKWDMRKKRINQSKFCETINICEAACNACRKVNLDLVAKSAIQGPMSCKCFAGLSATSIPIYAGTLVVGYLKTGQVFHKTPTQKGFEKAMRAIGPENFTSAQYNLLKKAYLETTVVSPERYQSMVTLLEHFARELSVEAENLALAENDKEPGNITKARDYIHANLGDAISLPAVARVAGMSESHFCRQFKVCTQMTFTEYVNYSRILWAKKELHLLSSRISEIAFMVGFQSLSQFNRCFVKYQGCSPSQYRDDISRMPENQKAG